MAGSALSYQGERMVRLVDGRDVSNYSPEWRLQCEAQTILDLPDRRQRIQYLDAIEHGWRTERGSYLKGRGKEARKEIEKIILALWEARKAEAAAPQP